MMTMMMISQFRTQYGLKPSCTYKPSESESVRQCIRGGQTSIVQYERRPVVWWWVVTSVVQYERSPVVWWWVVRRNRTNEVGYWSNS